MKPLIYLLLLGLIPGFGHAQSLERHVIGGAGTAVSISNAQLSFTLGEPITLTARNATVKLTQGFQQNAPTDVLSIDAYSFTTPELIAFPNPTSSLLNIQILGTWNQQLTQIEVEVIDLHGALVMKDQLPPSGGSLDVSDLAASTYTAILKQPNGDVINRIRFVKY